jgi:NAD(P)-dependent dehydrogenase (short-subunit alcohol dehydrogenase family)
MDPLMIDQHAVDADLARVERDLAVNVLGAWRTTVAVAALLSRGARVVNVSSGAGSFEETGGAGGTPACSRSMAALNMLTAKLVLRVSDPSEALEPR